MNRRKSRRSDYHMWAQMIRIAANMIMHSKSGQAKEGGIGGDLDTVGPDTIKGIQERTFTPMAPRITNLDYNWNTGEIDTNIKYP